MDEDRHDFRQGHMAGILSFFIRICKRAALTQLLKGVAKIIPKAEIYQKVLPLFFPLVASIRELKNFFGFLRRSAFKLG